MPSESPLSRQRRALFYVFDGGTGVGHLRRLACIARQLQGRISCLIVTGHRAAAHWFVPDECEYVHLPSWDSLLEAKAHSWGREPFVDVDTAGAVRLRRMMLAGVVRAFRPDAIFVDHLPLGMQEELATILARTRCRKYLVTRGVLNETEDLGRLILGGRALEFLKSHYDRVFAASDPRVFDFALQYNVAPEIRAKIQHTGYVVKPIPRDLIARTRAERGVGDGEFWVVASAGGGQTGERFIEECLGLAEAHSGLAFDVVLGPRSKLPWAGGHQTTVVRGRLRVHKEFPNLAALHASADLVISSGGYNTVLEALQGSATILCFPLRKDERDEPYQHALRLKKFADLDVSTRLDDLPRLFEQAIARLGPGRPADRRSELDLGGAAAIERVVFEDLGIPHEADPVGAGQCGGAGRR